MINILIPSGGKSNFFKDSYYPKNLYEVNGKPMIQRVIEGINVNDSGFIFVFNQDECDKFHTDNIATLLTKGKLQIVRLADVTGGALCSCLMAVEWIDNNDELVIVNSDQIIDKDIEAILQLFREKNTECGLVCFESIHPRWSYVKTTGDEVIQVAEKCPVSRNAIAGFYYFKQGRDFVETAKRAILKDSTYEGRFYISAAVNEMILMNKNVRMQLIDSKLYKTFYSPETVAQYENELRGV